MPGVRTGESDSLDPIDVMNQLEETGEVAGRIVRRRIVIHDLAEQLYFTVACSCGLAYFGEDVAPDWECGNCDACDEMARWSAKRLAASA